MDVLSKYDAQLKSVLEQQSQLESSTVTDATVVGLTRRENVWLNFSGPGVWKRAVAVLIIMVVLVPVAVYKLYPQNSEE